MANKDKKRLDEIETSSTLKTHDDSTSSNISIDDCKTVDIIVDDAGEEAEKAYKQKMLDAANKKRKLTAPTGESDKKKWPKLFKKKNEPEEEQILTMAEVEATSRSNTVKRFNPQLDQGLTEAQVQERVAAELINNTTKTYSKTYRQIFVSNIFTFFNILCILIAIALILVGSWGDLFFVLILVLNTTIGIYQEIRAKRTIDKMTIVTAPTATVIREGVTKEISVKDLVLDDITILKNGKQISVDCIIKEGTIEVNEALLTGESIPVKKTIGDQLYAGSFISSGSCKALVDKVGKDCYIQKLQAKAKRYSKPKSELLRSLKLVISAIGIIIIPLGLFVGITNYKSATKQALNPKYDNNGQFNVYAVTESDKQYLIGEIDNIDHLTYKDYSLATQSVNNEDTFPKEILNSISKIKIVYTKKVSGNIGLSNLVVSVKTSSENRPIECFKIQDFSYQSSDDEKQYEFSFDNLGKKAYYTSDAEHHALKFDEQGNSMTTIDFKDNIGTLDSNNYVEYFIVTLQLRSHGYAKGSASYNDFVIYTTVTKTAGSLIGMIPAGMFLLTSMALAVGVLKLAKHKTLVQELYCIEMLARVDVLCLDKTGTITDGTMKVKEVITLDNDEKIDIDQIMGSFLNALEDNNQTSIALQNRFGINVEYKKQVTLPFSSARKLSAVTFEGNVGTFILGAPEFVYNGKSKKLWQIVNQKASLGYRVLMLAHSDAPIKNDKVPANNTALALFILEDHIREDAADTIRWFNENGVAVKVISGDNPATVSEIASRVGIANAKDYISLEGLSAADVETIADEYTVFGRVTPEQKAILVKALKKKGKAVAMTGDGVNDILAMKEADCSIAMAGGSEAARNVSHLVLMDSNFASMPKVVEEGRRVINNVQRSASLFLMKTIFTMVLTLITIMLPKVFVNGYPFVTKQLMLLESFVIGIPAFFIAIQPNKNKITGNFLKNVFSNCLPSALVLLLSVFAVYFLGTMKSFDISNAEEASSMCVLCITYVGLVILYNTCRPMNTYRGVVFTLMFTMVSLLVAFLPEYFGIYKMPGLVNTMLVIIIILVMIPIVHSLSDLLKRLNVEKDNNA